MPLFAPASSSSGPTFRVAARWHEARTFSNIGTSFVDVYNVGLNNQRQIVDFTGSTQYRVIYHYQNVGGSVQSAQVVDAVTNSNVLDTRSDSGTAAEKELDSGWQSLPAWATGESWLEVQMKAATSTDDPVFRGCVVLLK